MYLRYLTLAITTVGLLPLSAHAGDSLFAPRSLKTRFTYQATVPTIQPGAKNVKVWLPIPSDNANQKIENLIVDSPLPYKINTEKKFGNRMIFVESSNPGKMLNVRVTFDVERLEATPLANNQRAEGPADVAPYLKPDKLVPTGGKWADIASGVTGDKKAALDIVKAIFDHTVATMQYDYKKESPKLGEGDVAFVCDYKKGNCSDLHSYLISLARSENVPAVLEYGFPVCGIPVPATVPSTGTITGYHCWTWFYDNERGWLSVDASDGRRWLDANRPDIKDKLCGNLVLERSAVAISRGRDLTLEPAQSGPPLNNFIYPYAESDGRPTDAKWELSYQLLSPAGTLASPPSDLQSQVDELRKIVLAQQDEINKLKGIVAESKPVDPVKPATVVQTGSKEKVQIYGFIRTDAMYDDQRPNPNGQIPLFVESPDNAKIGANSNSLTFHPRLTRVGFNFTDTAKSVRGWDLTGKVEFDFQGGGSESRPTPRGRLAYAQLKRNDWSIQFGQNWDLISPVSPSPNDDTLMWNAGNLGDRRPQLRFTYEPKAQPFGAAVAFGLTGAIDAKDLDGNGVRDGEASGTPHIQARLYSRNPKAQVGVWGVYGREKTKDLVGGRRNFVSQGAGVDWKYQVTPLFDFSGEAWTGSNMSDLRGGIGQGINATTGKAIQTMGGWAEVGMLANPKHRIAIGYTIENPNDADLPAGGRTRNFAYYVHNKWSLATNLEMGINYLRWITDYKGLRKGIDNRFNLFLTYRF